MTFAFVKTKTVRRKVTINVPNDGEGFTPAPCFVTFDIIPNSDKVALDQEFFKKNVRNIEDLVDMETKSPIPFTPEFLADFLSVPYVLSALIREYMNCTLGAGRGN